MIRDLIDKGLQEKKTIELQVLKVNQRAFILYKSLGFTLKDENLTHYQMTYSTHLSRATKDIDSGNSGLNSFMHLIRGLKDE